MMFRQNRGDRQNILPQDESLSNFENQLENAERVDDDGCSYRSSQVVTNNELDEFAQSSFFNQYRGGKLEHPFGEEDEIAREMRGVEDHRGGGRV